MLDEVLKIHKKHTGVLNIETTEDVRNNQDLALIYTPGVAEISLMIKKDHDLAREFTISGKLVAVITDGSAVLGLGNVGSQAGLPIVEGKALLYKNLADVNAVPLAIEQKPVDEIVQTIENLQNSFSGIHLEDIAAPQCFEIEERLQELLEIPVYHDDQEGTAIVILAGLINAAKLQGTELKEMKILINGVGASGVATAKLLIAAGNSNITLVDLQGVLKADDQTINRYQRALLDEMTVDTLNMTTLEEAIVGQDAFIGLSASDVLTPEMIETMNDKPIIFALANPKPEIDPDLAKKHGVQLMATGSSKYPNQINNILAFPGLFKGLLRSKAKKVDLSLQLVVAQRLADMVQKPSAEKFIPNVFDGDVAEAVSESVFAHVQKEK